MPNNYSQNSKKNVFNDLIPKKRQNMDFDNKYVKTIYDILNKKDNYIEEDIRKKKKENNLKKEEIFDSFYFIY